MYTIIETIKPTKFTVNSEMFKNKSTALFVILEPKEIQFVSDITNKMANIITPDGESLNLKIVSTFINKSNVVGILLDNSIDVSIARLSKISW